MTEFPGLRAGLRLAEGPATSGSLGKGAWSTSGPLLWAASLPRGPQGGSGVVAVAHGPQPGIEEGLYGGRLLFERVIVTPRSRDAGFVLSEQRWVVDVWNTHRRLPRTLSSIQITGAGGLQVSGGLGSAANFGPGQSSIYLATLAGQGDPTIQATATWNFTGETGADMTVTGTRITVFSPEIDWSDGFTETIEFLTSVLASTSGAEQRIQLRTKPRYGAAFRVLTLEAQDSAALDALLFGWQGRVFGVPWWMDASVLTAQANPGDTTLQVDTTARASYQAGGLVMLWRDQHTWEAMGVLAVSSGSVSLSSQVVGTWPAGALVVPLKRGRMSDMVDVDGPTNWASVFQVSFECEVV